MAPNPAIPRARTSAFSAFQSQSTSSRGRSQSWRHRYQRIATHPGGVDLAELLHGTRRVHRLECRNHKCQYSISLNVVRSLVSGANAKLDCCLLFRHTEMGIQSASATARWTSSAIARCRQLASPWQWRRVRSPEKRAMSVATETTRSRAGSALRTSSRRRAHQQVCGYMWCHPGNDTVLRISALAAGRRSLSVSGRRFVSQCGATVIKSSARSSREGHNPGGASSGCFPDRICLQAAMTDPFRGCESFMPGSPQAATAGTSSASVRMRWRRIGQLNGIGDRLERLPEAFFDKRDREERPGPLRSTNFSMGLVKRA